MNSTQQSPVVRGFGWIADGAAGSLRKPQRFAWDDAAADNARPPDGLFARPVRNWNRFDRTSRVVCSLCALALADAEIADEEGRKTATGLLISNPNGALPANRAYWQDYLDAGRQMARGNLFVYTLPSSPLAEAAIHFGFQGPLLYLGGPGSETEQLRIAARWIRTGEAETVVIVEADERAGVAVVIAATGPRSPDPAGPPADLPASIARRFVAMQEMEKTW